MVNGIQQLMRFGVLVGLFGLFNIFNFQCAFAEQTSDVTVQKIQGVGVNSTNEPQLIAQKAKMWGLSIKQYRQYLNEMATTPSTRWWKNIDPPQILGMNATTENERMEFAMIDARLDHVRASREIAFQHAYSKALAKLYPNAKLIAINTNKQTQSANIHNHDQYYLFTALNDPEGAMLATKITQLMAKKSDVTLNIFFVGSASVQNIQSWATGNNLPTRMQRADRITLNQNKEGVYCVIGYVDSQNSFGAMIRSNWTVGYSLEGDTVYPLYVEISDNVLLDLTNMLV